MSDPTRPVSTLNGQSTGRPLLLVFGALLLGLVLSMTAVIGVSTLRASSSAIDHLWADAANQLLARVVVHVRSIYEPASAFARYSESSVQSQRLDPRDVPALHAHLEAVIDAFPTIVWASFGTADGEYISVYRWPVGDDRWEIRRTHRVIEGQKTWFREDTRTADGAWRSTRDERSTLYDPRTKGWWKSAHAAAHGVARWNPPALFFSRKQLGLIYSMPSHDPETGTFLGAWAAEFEAGPVVSYLADLETNPGTRVYVLAEQGTVVSQPDGPLVGEESLLTADTSGDELLAAAWQVIQAGEAVEGTPFEVREHVAMFRKMPTESGLPWHVLVTVPTSTLFGETRAQARAAIIVGIIGVLLSLLLTIAATVALKRVIQSRVADAILATKVGQYTLETKVGSGGMGDVFIASHSMLRRPTAIKLLRANSPVEIQRFEHEVQMTCRLSHPNTITIFDYGRTPDGRFYYAMELIDGATLHELVWYAGALPAGRVIFLAEQICGALAEAHSFGLVHRDIKPANILVAELGGRGDFVKVVDFGLVKDVELGDQGITQDGSFAGTPGFLAPEVPVSPQMVGPVTDIYSVGAVMYVLLTGDLPFEGDSGMAVFLNQQVTDPVPPSERSGVAVPPDLEALVMRCLARKPANRPATADALRDALFACTDAGTWSEDDANDWWQAHGERLRELGDSDHSEPHSSTVMGQPRPRPDDRTRPMDELPS